MIKCVNPKCEYYKQELDDSCDVCPKCGEKTENIKSKVNMTLAIIASAISLIGYILIFWWFFEVVPAIIVIAVGIVAAFLSKSKAAIIITIVSLVALLAQLLIYGVLSF